MKFATFTNILPYIGLFALLTACSPSTIITNTYSLRPISGDMATLDGKPVTRAEQNGVAVVASFEREEDDFVALDGTSRSKI